MARRLKADRVLFIATFLLVCTSIVMVYSASAVWSERRHGDEYHMVTMQVLWAVLGLAMLAIAMRIDYRTYRTDAFAWTAVVAVGLLLVAVLLVGMQLNGARRWLGVSGLRFQPSEFAKLACVMFTALVLERRMHRIDEVGYSLTRIAVVVGLLVGLIAIQPDFGTSVTVLVITGVMVFAAGLRYQYTIGAALAAVPVVGVTLISKDFQWARFEAFWDPWAHAATGGYQVIQSMIAVASGGLFGRGLSFGVQKDRLPYSYNDFIYATISEELGMIGAAGVLCCFCVIAWRGLRIAVRAEEAFGALVAIGITTMICAQAFVNICVALSLLPTKGIPLPLVSAGGSSLVVSLVGIGVLLNISQHETARV